MKIDLCKLFGVEEGEEFRIGISETRHRFYNNSLQVFDTDLDEWRNSSIIFNYVISSDIIKLPKRKEFTDDELMLFRLIDKKYKYIVKDASGDIVIFCDKPHKDYKCQEWDSDNINWESLNGFENILINLSWEDEEPVFIDDYVER